ncbi:hypothetical protein D3C85_1272970 [compost metagenome]
MQDSFDKSVMGLGNLPISPADGRYLEQAFLINRRNRVAKVRRGLSMWITDKNELKLLSWIVPALDRLIDPLPGSLNDIAV